MYSSNDYNTQLYCPDFTVTRCPTKRTVKRNANYFDVYENPVLYISRPQIDSSMIPVTDVDDFIDDKFVNRENSGIMNYVNPSIILRKNNTRNIVEALEMFATHLNKSYDSSTNMDKTEYIVPIVGFLNNNQNKTSSLYNDARSSHHTSSSDMTQKKERFVVINNDLYSCMKTYKPHCGRYVPLNIPENFTQSMMNVPDIPENTQTYRVSKKTLNKSDIYITMANEVRLSGLSVYPEEMYFKKIHSTAFHCNDKCTKNKHCITCLDNDPGYLTSFKMMIRSSDTNNQWILVGTFAGNCSMFDSTLISFDEMLVKEIKITPITYHNSFEKARLWPVGAKISSVCISDDSYVTYTVLTPRDGKYLKRFDKHFKFDSATFMCNCSGCIGGSNNGKGAYKKKSFMMRDMLNNF